MKWLITFFVVLAGMVPATAQDWGCYDPKPGHPTSAERTAYVDEVSRYAVAAEKKYGVPAAAIAAMSIAESGYGFTRTAIEANNLFGWKYTGKLQEGDPGIYTLGCQPPEDVNKRYVVFKSREDAIDFVASRLAKSAYYKLDTQKYISDRRNGADIITASRSWVAGISNPYNWRPQEYLRTISRLMNSPLAPSDTVDPQANLYKLSMTAKPTVATGSLASADLIAYAETVINPAVLANCGTPVLNFDRWAGFPITQCDYSDIGATVRTYFLNADKGKLARWVVTACEDAKAANGKKCVDVLVGLMKDAASYSVFPISGYIPEPEYGGQCFYFRDGVTAWPTSLPKFRKPSNGTCDPDIKDDEPLTRSGKYGRVISVTRLDYKAAGLPGDTNGLAFVDRVREAYQKAWNSDRNDLISAKAKALKAAGEI